jgi:hypothetical protein
MTRSAELNQLIFNHLSAFITEHKLKRFDEVLKNRTRYITVVIEDVYQPHNASAKALCEYNLFHIYRNKHQHVY